MCTSCNAQREATRMSRRVVWVDPEFQSGRLKRFLTVPCNTKVDIRAFWLHFIRLCWIQQLQDCICCARFGSVCYMPNQLLAMPIRSAAVG